MTETNDLRPGQIVYLATGTRHDTVAFPYAIVTHQAYKVWGDSVRYRALLVNDLFIPTDSIRASVFDDEIVAVSKCPPLSPEAVTRLREIAGR